MKTIVLVGMMGCGKSTVGNILSEITEFEQVDIDEKIITLKGISISKIFEQYGESYFRELEKQTIEKYLSKENFIISTGGGAFENSETRNLLLNNANVIYLKTSADVLYQRLKNDVSRPLLKNSNNIETITNLVKKRERNYLKAQYIISTDGKTAIEIANEILKECGWKR